MAYTVLARKYRSQTFDDVIGQDAISQTLKNAIKTGRVAHAYLFCGTRGVGKTTMARILAKSLNCLESKEPTVKPCCKCESCLAVNAGDDIDVIEIDGATNNGVDQVRELRENAIYRPARARYKIYIIDEVHMLSVGAFNALLKILEEPPSHVKFIFATTEPNKVIATIQSRCQRFDFNNISPAAIAKQLKYILNEEKIKFDEDLIAPLAKMANGSMRDGLSLLDRLISTGEELKAGLLEEFLGCPNSEKIYGLIEKIGDSDAATVMAKIEELVTAGLNEVQIVDALTENLRDIMVMKSTDENSDILILTQEQKKRVKELAEKFDIAAIIYNITVLEKLRWAVKNSETARALLEASILRMALSAHFMNVDTLISQLRTGGEQGSNIKRSADIKKNITTEARPSSTAVLIPAQADKPTVHVDGGRLGDVGTIAEKWEEILDAIASRVGTGCKGILSSARPSSFENGVLTLTFADQMMKKLCENGGRVEKIEAALSEQLGKAIKVQFEAGKAEKAAEQPVSQKRNEIISDPAVKAILSGMNATITNIEENEDEKSSDNSEGQV